MSEQVSSPQPLPEDEEEDDDEILLSFKFVSIYHILNTFHEVI
jgi:hypothetical protein